MQNNGTPNLFAEMRERLPDLAEPITHLRRRLAEAKRVLVLTGAGVSAESGVPTFRGGGNSAVWKDSRSTSFHPA